MHCLNCGKDILFSGKVCPHCHVDNTASQSVTMFGVIGLVVGGVIGGLVWGIGGVLVVGLIGAIIGVGGGMASVSKKKQTGAPQEHHRQRQQEAETSASLPPKAANSTETCANCGRLIGKLETPHLFNDNVVCSGCDKVLRED